jgi:superfamily II DNA or RNA helicase
MKDLFTPLTRDERQEESLKAWLQNKGKGCIEGCTGYGKTRIGLNAIETVRKRYPELSVIVVVPTDVLRTQWLEQLDQRGLGWNCKVQIINTASKTIDQCDLLILDEVHKFAADQFSHVFKTVKYKHVLGLTATIERLDGKHELIKKYCPVVDTVTIEVAKANGWVSEFTEYQVIVSAEDIDIYRDYNKEFVQHFEFFDFDFGLAMSMIGPKGLTNRLNYRDQLCPNGSKEEKSKVLKEIMYHSMGFMHALQNRKKFIHNHPQKIEVAREIIKHRADKKIITFSANTKMAEAIGVGYVYTGKEGKKKNRITIDEFKQLDKGVINSCKLAIEGFDCPGLSVGIVMGVDSSATKAIQSTGRVVRKEGSKYAEMFTLVMENTVEQEWFKKSHPKGDYVTIDVENLIKMLKGEEWSPYKKKIQNYTYRF